MAARTAPPTTLLWGDATALREGHGELGRARPARSLVVGVLVGAAALVLGCATLALPDKTDAAWAAERWPGTTQDDLTSARALYVTRCGGCHAPRLPERYPQDRWEHHLDQMAKRAKLRPGERDQLLHFLLTMSRPRAATPPNGPR